MEKSLHEYECTETFYAIKWDGNNLSDIKQLFDDKDGNTFVVIGRELRIYAAVAQHVPINHWIVKLFDAFIIMDDGNFPENFHTYDPYMYE